MKTIRYPEGDSRRLAALIPHGTRVEVAYATTHLVFVKWRGELWPVSPDYLFND